MPATSHETWVQVPAASGGRFAWLYLVAWLPYLVAYGLVLSTALDVPISWAVAGAVANGLPPAALGWAAIGMGRRITWRTVPVARFLAFHGAAAAVYALACATGTWLLFRIFDRLELGAWNWSLGEVGPLVWQLLIATLLYAVLAGIGNAIALQHRLREEEARAARARELATRSQLEALRARLDPHFLFNTLHSLLALVRRDPIAAEAGLERFGDLLHYTLHTGDDEEEEVTFAKELTFVAGYLELESLRLGDRLVWRETIEPETLACRVPALSLQPLVENALRHAVAPRAGGGRIELRTRIDGGRLEIEVADDGPGAEPSALENGGLGLELVRQRLETLHGAAAGLQIETAPGAGFTARIWMPAVREGEEVER